MQDKIQWIKQNPHLCISPFNNWDYRIQQNKLKITVCCNLDTTFTDQEIDDDFIYDLQRDIKRGQLPRACHLCDAIEKTGAQSERIKYLLDFDQAVLKNTPIDLLPKDSTVGMKFSNRCNLACRSCNSFDSSLWSEKMQVPADPGIDVDIATVPRYWQQMTETIRKKHSETDNFILHPIGGETLLQQGFIKLLDWMIDTNLASTTSLRITTNLAVNLEELRERLLQFRNTWFLSSIDSVHENYHYVRWPARFSKVQQNLEEILHVRQHWPGKYDLLITPVFSLNNIFYCVDWLDHWYQWCTKHELPLWLQTTHINRPAALMVETLPEQYRPQLIEILSQAVEHVFFKTYPTYTNVQREYFVSMLALLQKPLQYPASLFDDYLKYSADYDCRTGTNSFELNSRLFDQLNDYHRTIYDQHYQSVDISKPVHNINTNGIIDLNV